MKKIKNVCHSRLRKNAKGKDFLKIYLVINLLFIIFFNANAYAAPDEKKCNPLQIKSENKEFALPGIDPPHVNYRLYLFKNLSDKSIWLDHPVPHPSVSAGWSSYLRPGHYSALWLDKKKKFNLSCALIKPGKVEYLDCATVISVCTPEATFRATSRKGTYWLAEDKTFDVLVKALVSRGVEIKD